MRLSTTTIDLGYDGPYDWPSIAAWLGSRAIGGIEILGADGRYVRSISLRGEIGTLSIAFAPEARALSATVRFPNVAAMPEIRARIARIFDLDTDLRAVEAHLATHARLAPLIAERPGLRVPGAWDGYELAVRAVLGQQISVAAASSLASRLVRRFGEPLSDELRTEGVDLVFPSPARLAEADVVSLGMPGARANAIRNLARAAAEDPLLFAPRNDLEGTIERLCSIGGIGPWTAHYIAMRGLREADAFPAADIGLMRALEDATGRRPTPRELLAVAEPWRPWRAYAAIHLWAHDAQRASLRKGAALSAR